MEQDQTEEQIELLEGKETNSIKQSAMLIDNVSFSVELKNKKKGEGEPKTITKKILQNITTKFDQGELIAIMGPSGAGKSSLLDILANIKKPSNLDEAFISMGTEIRNFNASSAERPCLVRQEDLLWPSATVREAIMFSARLRLPSTMTLKEKEERVAQVIKELELTHCADTLIGGKSHKGISGGEMKRVSIGIELVSNPSIIFLDEPTSGLDASMSLSTIKVLRKLANTNRTVVCTIHQPRYEIFQEFDKLMLLAQGQVAYFGPTSQSVDYFTNLGYKFNPLDNPADVMMDMLHDSNDDTLELAEEGNVTSSKLDELRNHYSNSKLSSELYDSVQLEKQEIKNLHKDSNQIKEPKKYQSTMLEQLKTLTIRNIRTSYRDPLLTKGLVIQYLITSILTGFVYFNLRKDEAGLQARVSLLFWNNLLVSLISAFNYVILFPSIRDIYNRESSSNSYSTSSFLLSIYLFDLPKQIILLLIYTVLITFISGLQSDSTSFFTFFLSNALIVQVSEGMSICISALSPTATEANVLITLPIYFWMIFTPFFVNGSNIPKWLVFMEYTSFYKWGVEVQLLNELDGIKLDCNELSPCPLSANDPSGIINVNGNNYTYQFIIDQINNQQICNIPTCAFETGRDWLQFLDIETFHVGTYLWVLFGMALFFRILAIVILKYVKVGKQ